MSPRALSLLFFGGCVVLATGFTRLGFWQVSRLQTRREVNRAAGAARALPPVKFDDPSAAAGLSESAMQNRRVSVTGRYDHAAEIVIRGQSEGGVPGVRIVTPLRPLRGDTAILVQRGFVTSGDARTVELAGLREEGVRRVTGLALVQPDSGVEGDPMESDGQLTWRRLDLAALRRRLPYPLHRWVLLQLPDSALPALPRRDEAPVLDDGPHLSYAVQWFSFAITALVVGYAVGVRKRK
jgi:surfeit locus 1 family protein